MKYRFCTRCVEREARYMTLTGSGKQYLCEQCAAGNGSKLPNGVIARYADGACLYSPEYAGPRS